MEIRVFRKFVRQIEREIDKQFKGEATCCGVTPVQCHTLLEVEILGKTNLVNLADILGLDKSTVSRTVDGLIKAGQLNRQVDESNRRNSIITLTGSGKQTCSQINDICDSYYEKIIASIPEEKLETVSESINILTDILFKVRNENNNCKNLNCNCS